MIIQQRDGSMSKRKTNLQEAEALLANEVENIAAYTTRVTRR